MMNWKMIPGIVFLSLFWLACEEETVIPEVLPPQNLQVSVSLSAEQPGAVTITASADRVNFYRFFLIDTDDFIEQKEGLLNYRYTNEGDFTIRVQAHTNAEVFIQKELQVNIDLGGPIGSEEGFSSPLQYSGYRLVWQDEFGGTNLSADWTHETGTGSNGWGNNELQYYRQENTWLENGYLLIEARKENFGGREFTSSRIITKDKQSFQYGRIDIRAKLPQGQGIWPALWMLGSNFGQVGWPRCGEIDIMEMIGGNASGRDNTVHGTVHWDNNGQYASFGGKKTLAEGKFSDQFHVFSIIWDARSIRWLLDDQQFHSIDITPAELSEFHQPYFFIFNVAVGGNWPGSPDASTSFPQKMIVDYVRVFQPE
jgi:hypothetical protein